MNRAIPKIGAVIVTIAVFLFAVCLMMVHGIFFIGCFIMPMTGVFTSMASGDAGNGGTIALLGWCVYFLPIGVLAYRHFQEAQ